MTQPFISMVMQYFNPSIIDRMARAFGESRDATQKVVVAGVPALLFVFARFATEPGGADRLASAARQQDRGILDNLSNIIGGSVQAAASDKGRTMLSLMLGSQASEGLIEAVADYGNLGKRSATNMMGLLAPVVMAVLGRHQSAQGLDAAGLARSLADQKSDVAGVMPSGLAAVLGDSFEAHGRAVAKPSRHARGPSWAYALAVILVLGLIGYWFWSYQPQVVARQDAGRAAVSSDAQAASVPIGATAEQNEIAKQLLTVVDSTGKSLAAVTNASTARDALPQLQDAVTQLDKVRRMTDQMPADGTKALTSIVADAKPALQQSISKVEAIPRVSDLLKPTLDSLQVRLDVFAIGLPQQRQSQRSLAAAPDPRP